MISTKYLKRTDILEEMKYMSNEGLLNQGALSGIQKELKQEYISPEYIREKLETVRRTMDAMERDLRILEKDMNEPRP